MEKRQAQTLVCAWCGKVMRRGNAEQSHGVCAACSRLIAAGVPLEQIKRGGRKQRR